MENSSGSDFMSQKFMALCALGPQPDWIPCGVRPGRTHEPSGSRRLLTVRRRYVRRGTRTIAHWASIHGYSLSVQRCKPGRTPQETRPLGSAQRRLEEIFLVGGERRFEGLLHRKNSTPIRGAVIARARLAGVRQVLVRDVQRGHDRDAFVADDLAGVAHFLQLSIEVVDRR